MVKFFHKDKFLFRVSEEDLKATDNIKSYGSPINDITKKQILKYLGTSRENIDLTIEQADDKQIVFSFAKLFEGMRIDVCEVELSAISTIKVIDWAFEMTDTISILQTSNEGLENKISRQDRLIDEMIEAKEKYQEEMLERICAVLDSRNGGHATMLDILERRRHEEEMLSKNQFMQIKLEGVVSPELEKVKVEPMPIELEEPLSNAITEVTDTDEETTHDETS